MKIVFMGTPDFASPVLRSLINEGYDVCAVVTQPDRPKGRKKTLTPPPVKEEAEKVGIPVLQPEKIKQQEAYEQVLAYEPDLIVTAAFGQILPTEILTSPKYGCINVHASLLPRYRGGAPIHQAIIDGEKETGITIMYMVEALDAGDILSQEAIPIEEDDHVGTLHDKLSDLGAKLLLDTIPKLVRGEIEPRTQREEEVTYAPNIRREQERIDWTRSSHDVYNHVRGMNPWPVAYTTCLGERLKVWWVEKQSITGDRQPGEILAIDDQGIIVQTGDQKAVKLTRVQPAGKKPMDTATFLRGAGQTLTVGMKLGE
ncbi:methionyl-tRNA formyltransferase [Texcoconibacillus texcoconensis]|uniref:Methionyl-tRNA formyltransferase n=1 Tax=Texcoconibacillus texcoconensis TaxID=1095777 RepID=A0A840QL95_9BACI|nr:methionyl-tRNA formyltransferase [Texcoconibacillus texcoconensis]MBB5172131.1 methionyl-tRNA formyltransferase [Texcoconibacillus texcoconensis]